MADDNPKDPMEDDEMDDEFEMDPFMGEDDFDMEDYDDYDEYETDDQQALDVVESTIENFLDVARVDNVYGETIQNGDTMVIPAAEVLAGLGFGVGFGRGTNDSEESENEGGGGGGGGGGRVLARPVAVIVSSPEGVRVEPVVDVTKIALAMFTAAGFMTAMFFRMVNPRRALREMKGD